MESKKLPIGYWVKRVDELLTSGIDDIQSSFGLTRTDWQVLSSINEKGQINKTELSGIIRPFADLQAFEQILKNFGDADLLRDENETLTLTGKGIELHKACFEKQKVFRQRVMASISEEQYQQTILTLQKMVENLIDKAN